MLFSDNTFCPYFQRLLSVHVVERFLQIESRCKERDVPLARFSATIKMLNAPCSAWLSFTKAVWKESNLIFSIVINFKYPTSFLMVARHAIGPNLSNSCVPVSLVKSTATASTKPSVEVKVLASVVPVICECFCLFR